MKTKTSLIFLFVFTTIVTLFTFSQNAGNGIAANVNDGMVIVPNNLCPVVYIPSIWDNSGLCEASNNYCEDNDSYATAHPINPGVTYQAYPEDENDYYSFSLYEQATVTIRVTDYFTTGQVQLRDADGILIEHDFSKPNGEMEIVKEINAGSYFIRVSTTPETFSTILYSLVVDHPQITPNVTPIPVCTPTITPTNTPSVESEPPLPSGYSMFDDFNGVGTLSEERWYTANEPAESCDGTQLNGYLQTQCQTATDDVYIYYEFLLDNFNFARAGVSIATEVITPDESGHLELNLVLNNESYTANIRRYSLTLYYNELAVVEHRPQDDTQKNLVTIEPFDGTQIHTLRIEYQPQVQSISFFIDDVEIVLDVQPEIPTGSRARRWEILQYLEPTQTLVNWESKVYWSAFTSQ